MSASESPVTASGVGAPGSRADVAWVVVCFALCGGLIVYLFAPYFVASLKGSEAALMAVGAVGAIVFAVLGVLLDSFLQRRSG